MGEISQLLEAEQSTEEEQSEGSSIHIDGSDELKVVAPSNCILYRSPSPDQAAYVKKGDIITADQTLCLLEVMKVFSPLKLTSFNKTNKEIYPSQQRYQVNHIKGVDGQQVNKGDLLFVIQPIKD